MKLHLFSSIWMILCPLVVMAWTPPIFMDTMEFEPTRELQLNTNKPVVTGAVGDADTESAPTGTPTESPAPSPSPSEVPTVSPTITGKPTGGPTIEPTESPAPSPSPSAVPTVSPTPDPTGTPSATPTQSPAPSNMPTTSRPPSPQPSPSPSSTPTAIPSAIPSALPTYVGDTEASFLIELEDFDYLLKISESNAFEKATAKYVSFFPLSEGSITDVTCAIFDQQIKTKPNTSDETDLKKYLEIVFLIKAQYIGTDVNFDLFDELNPQFQNRNSVWTRALADEDTIFLPLVPVSQNIVTQIDGGAKEKQSGGNATLSKSSYTIILLMSFFALVLALVASAYALRHHSLTTFGTELRSPSSKPKHEKDVTPRHHNRHSHPFFNTAADVGAKVTMSTSSDRSFGQNPLYEATIARPKSQLPLRQQPQQPHLAKQAQEAQPPIKDPPHAHHQERRKSQHADNLMVPPPPPPPLPVPTRSQSPGKRKERDPVAHRASEIREPPPAFSEVNFGRESSLFDRQSIFSDEDETEDEESVIPGRISNTMADRIAKFEKPPSETGAVGLELELTKSFGGTLGAKSISKPPSLTNSGSDISSQAKAFFDNLVKKTSEQLAGKTTNTGNGHQAAGAVGVGPTAQNSNSSNGQMRRSSLQQTGNRRGSFESIMRKPGLYDVFAPPGPIGIVVDTTEHGPVVHSLKNTSPMTGLIEPGDIIIALDDVDTRSFSAATLTRLMASKANQKERKITLLTVDGK